MLGSYWIGSWNLEQGYVKISTGNIFPKQQKGVCSQSNGGLDSTQTITTFKLQWIRNVGESEFVEREFVERVIFLFL